jgi:hypothetical protein
MDSKPRYYLSCVAFPCHGFAVGEGMSVQLDGYLTNNPTTRPGIDLQGGPSLEKNSVFSWLEKTLIFLARKNCREDNGWSGL